MASRLTTARPAGVSGWIEANSIRSWTAWKCRPKLVNRASRRIRYRLRDLRSMTDATTGETTGEMMTGTAVAMTMTGTAITARRRSASTGSATSSTSTKNDFYLPNEKDDTESTSSHSPPTRLRSGGHFFAGSLFPGIFCHRLALERSEPARGVAARGIPGGGIVKTRPVPPVPHETARPSPGHVLGGGLLLCLRAGSKQRNQP